jgi:DnaK suppressor protein
VGKAASKKIVGKVSAGSGKSGSATKSAKPVAAAASTRAPAAKPAVAKATSAKPAVGKSASGKSVAAKSSPDKASATKAPPAKVPAAKPAKAPSVNVPPVKASTAKASPGKPAPAAGSPSAKTSPAKPASPKPGSKTPETAKFLVNAATGKPIPGKPGSVPAFKPKPGAIYITPGAGLKGKPPETSNGKKDARAAKAARAEERAERPAGPTLAMLEPASSADDGKPKKNLAGLTVKELQFFRDLLLEKRRELVGDMSNMEREALQSGDSGLSTLPIHMADMGTDNYEQEFTLGLVEKDRVLLREINHALAKIQNGTYGICEGNGKPISKVRLEAQPWARHSIEYARLQEKGPIRR